jgi:drug/metabolite transporter (DMT)-like permease
VPFLASASNRQAIVAGVQVGGLCALGYAAQALALGMGTSPGTAAFICSLQSVVVALMAARSSGVAVQTWLAVALSVAGVGCLELPSVLAAGDGGVTGPCIGDLIAFGQPLGFGLSYVVLEKGMKENPEDELPLAALQCAVVALAAVAAASAHGGVSPWQLDWGHLIPHAAIGEVLSFEQQWGVPIAVLYTGVISTALTIWLCNSVFKRLPATDASIILASEPLWATGFAALLLHAPLTASTFAGGGLILFALLSNEGLCDPLLPASMRGSKQE